MTNKTIIAAIAIVLINACQPKVDVEVEQNAILQVLLDEGAAFAAYDLDKISALHVQDETTWRLEGGENVYSGWTTIRDLYESYFKRNKDFMEANQVQNFANSKENAVIKVYENTAWVSCDNIWTWEAAGKTQVNKNRQLTFLEKRDGLWKISSNAFIPISQASQNLALSTTYHKLDPADIDDLLTDNFIGQNEKGRFTWTKENHKDYWTNNPGTAKDTIYHQIADDNWVATRFNRKMKWQGKDVSFDAMQFKRIEDGKIAEIWEYNDTRQAD